MRTSLFVKTFHRTDAGLKDWWALETLANAAESAIQNSAKYGRAFPRPSDFFPVFHIEKIEDLDHVKEHRKAVLTRVCEGHSEVGQILAMPGLLQRRPNPPTTSDVLINAAERFHQAGIVARQMVTASLNSVTCAQEVVDSYPGIELVVVAWNKAFRDFTESYEAYVESIPDALARMVAGARVGQTEGLNLNFQVKIEVDLIEHAMDLMNRNTLERQIAEFSVSESSGKIYALFNPSMPGLIKIGKTRRHSKARADELSTTGVPTPFMVLYEVDVEDCDKAERQVHDALAEFRVSDRREFFRVAPKVAIDAMTSLKGKSQTMASGS